MTDITFFHVLFLLFFFFCLHLPNGTLLVFMARETTIAKSVTFGIHIKETFLRGSLGFCNIKKKKFCTPETNTKL